MKAKIDNFLRYFLLGKKGFGLFWNVLITYFLIFVKTKTTRNRFCNTLLDNAGIFKLEFKFSTKWLALIQSLIQSAKPVVDSPSPTQYEWLI